MNSEQILIYYIIIKLKYTEYLINDFRFKHIDAWLIEFEFIFLRIMISYSR